MTTQLNGTATPFWQYLRHELLFVSWALAEASLIAPIFLANAYWARYWPPLPFALLLLLLMLIPFNLSRVLSLLKVPLSRQQLFAGGMLFFLITASWRLLLFSGPLFSAAWLSELWSHIIGKQNPFWNRDIMTFILLIVTWWRGSTLSGRAPDIERTGLYFRISALLILPFILWSGRHLEGKLLIFLILFFAASLLSIVLTRAAQIEQSLGEDAVAMRPSWLFVIFGAIFLTIISAMILAFITADPETQQNLLAYIHPIPLAAQMMLRTIAATLLYIAAPLIILLDWAIRSMIMFVSNFQLRQSNSDPAPPAPSGTQELPTFQELFEGFGTNTPGSIPPRLYIILVMIILVLFLAILVRRYAGNSPINLAASQQMEQNDRATSSSRKRQSRSWFRDPMKQLRQWRAALSIRYIYKQMCTAAATVGLPRHSNETAYEYLPRLIQVWPDGKNECQIITNAFVQIRYGERPETAAELAEIQKAWDHLERMEPSVIISE